MPLIRRETKMKFDKIKNDEKKYIMNTYGRFNAALESGKGSRALDCDGREYIDFTSGIGVNSLGWCDDGWVKAVSEQAGRLQHISNLYTSPVQVECAKLLCEKTGFSKVFFSNSGAEANECAIKLARKYSFDNYGDGRNEIISLKNSFHGRTVTTLAATGQDVFHNYFFPFTEGFVFAEANNIDSVSSLICGKTCAVMMELIQGEGGVMPLDKDFVLAVERLCRENDLCLIIDEVQTGVGRTGTLYCFESYGIEPDILTSAKGLGGGLPFGACMCSERLSAVLTPGTHATTYGGNPVVCAGSIEVLKRVGDPDFLKAVREKGEYIKGKILKMNGVSDVRGLGMMIGIVLEKDNAREVVEKCLENGLLVLTAKNLVRLLPPLNISYEDIDRGLEILEGAI